MWLDQVQIRDKSVGQFLLDEATQDYLVAPGGYVDRSNPSGPTIFDPLDATRVKVNRVGELPLNLTVYSVTNDCNCVVVIKIFNKAVRPAGI